MPLNQKIWINGTFDVLHMGHIRLFEYAKNLHCSPTPNLKNYVCVGIDTDERIREMKGVNRPINNLTHRKEFLESIKFIDEVVVFGTDNELIEQIVKFSPNIMVIGGDYKDKEIIGSNYIPKIE